MEVLMPSRLQIASRAARAAGQILLNKLHDGREITSKGKRDIVTDADFAADKTIRRILLAYFPADRIMSEESPKTEREQLWTQAKQSDALHVWVVDPLDGTTNYSRLLYPFGVSIALYRAGIVHLGVVYDPIRKEMFAAERGRGATLNRQRISVSHKQTLEDAVIGTEWARAPRLRTRSSKIFGKIIYQAMTGRAYGSAALSLCAVAAGRLDGYIHLSLSPWDVAAAALIVEEAGGVVTTPTGARWDIHSQAYVASNGYLHSKLLRYFK